MLASKFVIGMPLISSILSGIVLKKYPDKYSQILTSFLIFCSLVCSLLVFKDVVFDHQVVNDNLLNWINIPGLSINLVVKVDTLTAVMLVIVTSVSFLVHVYSIGYMEQDKSIPRFMSYLSLFTFAMLVLVTSNNLIQLFFGWEGVGVCSYLLIGFWYKKKSACNAAIKAFLVNRVGDFSLLIGISAIYLVFGSINFSDIFTNLPNYVSYKIAISGIEFNFIDFVGITLFIGCMGKSAQLFLHTWLPDAMEGPTPVSALIHAATMVTAGIFLVARFSPLYELSSNAREMILLVGGVTAFIAATIALTQNDIKKIIAYSTCSQLGYMFVACGLSAYNVAIFHLATHAFFKALLFLSAGSVIHAMHHEQDINNMGGLWNKIPMTYAMFWIGSLAIAGIPPLAGFYSKDAILELAYVGSSGLANFIYILIITAAFFTAFYSWRLIFKVFHGTKNYNAETESHIHESPWVMMGPLFILAIGAIFSGYYGYHSLEIINDKLAFWNNSIVISESNNLLEKIHHIPELIKILPNILTIIAILFAFIMYVKMPKIPDFLMTKLKPLYNLSYNKYYFDEAYDLIFVKPFIKLSNILFEFFDVMVVDRLGPNGFAGIVRLFSRYTSKLQTGYVYHYLLVMLMGVLLLLTWYISGII